MNGFHTYMRVISPQFSFYTLNSYFKKYLTLINNRSDEMKTISTSIFILSMTASSLLAGNCANHNKANLEAMSCEAGFTWNETKAECVQDTA